MHSASSTGADGSPRTTDGDDSVVKTFPVGNFLTNWRTAFGRVASDLPHRRPSTFRVTGEDPR